MTMKKKIIAKDNDDRCCGREDLINATIGSSKEF